MDSTADASVLSPNLGTDAFFVNFSQQRQPHQMSAIHSTEVTSPQTTSASQEDLDMLSEMLNSSRSLPNSAIAGQFQNLEPAKLAGFAEPNSARHKAFSYHASTSSNHSQSPLPFTLPDNTFQYPPTSFGSFPNSYSLPAPTGSSQTGSDFDHYRTPSDALQSVGTASGAFSIDKRDETDLIFTPLMSPAVTPLSSVFSSSTGMPSTFKPIEDALSASHITPAEMFSPLTSPALRPQHSSAPPSISGITSQATSRSMSSQAALYQVPPVNQQYLDHVAQLAARDPTLLANQAVQASNEAQLHALSAFMHGQRQTLQALGFGHLLSPSLLPMQQQASAQQIPPLDLVQILAASQAQVVPQTSGNSPPESSSSNNSAAGGPREYVSGRGRGASRTAPKARPSPIIKPLTSSSGPSKYSSRSRKNSLSGGTPSLRGSPAMSPVVYSSNGPQPVALLEESPSPVDLAGFLPPSVLAPGSAVSSSAHQAHLEGDQQLVQQPFAPVTPALLMNMNLSNEVVMLPGPSPALGPTSAKPTTQQEAQSKPVSKPFAVPPPPIPRAAAAAASKAKAGRAPRKAKTAGSQKLTDVDYNEEEPDGDKKVSHKYAEQRRRDSLKNCFEELRLLLPYIPPEEDEDAPKRPGEGNVGGSRSASAIDASNPNKGVSKVALLRKSNEFINKLGDRVSRRDQVIFALRTKLAALGVVAEFDEDLAGLALDDLDAVEQGAWPAKEYSADLMTLVEDDDGRTRRKPQPRASTRRRGQDD